MCVQAILPSSPVLSSSGATHGLTQLGLRSYPSGSFVPETVTMLFLFIGPDRPVYTTALVRPLGPCQPTSAVAGPVFSYLWNPYPSVSGGIYDIHGCLHSGVGRPHGEFQNFGYLGPSGPPAPHQLLGTRGGRGCLHHWAPVLQGHQVMIATDNSTVLSYINKHGGTQSHTLLRLVVELFMWLQAQNIVVRARHIPGCLNMIADHLSRPNLPIPTKWSLHPEIVSRIFGVWGDPSSGHVCNCGKLPTFLSSCLRFRSHKHWRWMLCLRAGRGGRCTCFLLFPCSASYSETTVDTGGRSNSDSRSNPGG